MTTTQNTRFPNKRLKALIAIAGITLVTLAHPGYGADNYFFDKKHSEIRFFYSHGDVSEQSGEFTRFDGELVFDEDNLANSSVSVKIAAKSIYTGVMELDGQMKNPYYFFMKNHPSITFQSSAFRKSGENEFEVDGVLTIKGIELGITLQAEIRHQGKHPVGQTLAYYRGDWLGIRAVTSFPRSEFEMTSFIPLVGDLIRVEINAELKARTKS